MYVIQVSLPSLLRTLPLFPSAPLLSLHIQGTKEEDEKQEA